MESRAKTLIEQVKKYPYAYFEMSEEQLSAVLREKPEFVVVDKGAIAVLEPSDSAEAQLHWATGNADSLIYTIQSLRKNLQAKMSGRWRMPFAHPDLVEPLCRFGFELDSHYMDYWLYGVAELTLNASQQEYIRKATPSDFSRLSEISAECSYSPGWIEEPEEWFAYWLSKENGEIFVADLEGEIAGYCCVDLYGSDSEKGTVVWIQALAVAPEYQRRGLGRTLLLIGLRWGQKGGAQRSFLAADKRNHISRKIYENLGYRPSGAEEINLVLQT
jgi:ribosomal protein S18 acetylase RimI-like enzyme